MEEEALFEGLAIYEPTRTNRFVIDIVGATIPEYLFRSYKLYNEGENLHLDTEFFEIVNFVFDPKEFFNITDISIAELDPTGVRIASTSFNILKSNFEKSGDYSDDSLSIVKLKFIVKVTTHKCHYPINLEPHKEEEV